MELASKSVSFSCNDTMYWWVDVISMGCPLGPLSSNVFMRFLEKQLFNKVHKFYKAYCYVHYVDGTFVSFPSHNEALKFFILWLDFSLFWFSLLRRKKDKMIPILDVLDEKDLSSFITNVFRKTTFTGLYISWDTFILESRKINLVKCLTHFLPLLIFKFFFWLWAQVKNHFVGALGTISKHQEKKPREVEIRGIIEITQT